MINTWIRKAIGRLTNIENTWQLQPIFKQLSSTCAVIFSSFTLSLNRVESCSERHTPHSRRHNTAAHTNTQTSRKPHTELCRTAIRRVIVTKQSQIKDGNSFLHKLKKNTIHIFLPTTRAVDKHVMTNHTVSNSDMHQSQAHTLPRQPSLVTGARADKFGLSFWGPEIPACLHTTAWKGKEEGERERAHKAREQRDRERKKGKREKGGIAEGGSFTWGGATEAGNRNGLRNRRELTSSLFHQTVLAGPDAFSRLSPTWLDD